MDTNTKPNLISEEELEQIGLLMNLAWIHAGIKIEKPELSHYRLLAETSSECVGCEIDSRAIKKLQLPNGSHTRKGFGLNVAKEVLAAFVLVQNGHIKKDDLLFKEDDPTKLQHNYWAKFQKFLQIEQHTYQNNSNVHNGFLHTIPSYFTNTVWRFFNKSPDGDITQHVVRIHAEIAVNLHRTTLEHAMEGYESYIGEVGMDSSKSFLIFNMATAETSHKDLHIKLKFPRGGFSAVLMGQANYIGTISNQIITDEVVMICEGREDDGPIDVQTTIYNANASTDLARMPSYVRTYFFDLGAVSLKSPLKECRTKEDFETYVYERLAEIRKITQDKVLESYCASYWIYHQVEKLDGEGVVEIDELELRIYKHHKDKRVVADLKLFDDRQYLEGTVTRYNSFISIYFTDFLGVETRTLYLQFEVRDFCYPEMECFGGILNGFRNQLEYSMSCQCLLVSKAVSDFQRKADSRMQKYFKGKRWGVCSVTPPRFRLDKIEAETVI